MTESVQVPIRNKHSSLRITIHVELDTLSASEDSLALGAAIASLTSEGWRLTEVQQREDGALTAILWRLWEVGRLPAVLMEGPASEGAQTPDGSDSGRG